MSSADAISRFDLLITGQRADGERHGGAGPESKSIALLLHSRHESGIVEWHGAQLIEHGFHLRHRFPRR